MYFSTELLSKYGDWLSRFCGGYVVLLGYSLYAKIGVCGLRLYCVLCVMVMMTGHSSIYYVLMLFGLCVGMWHDLSILSQLVWLERVRNRRKDTLILQGESRNVRNFVKYPYSRPPKIVKFRPLLQRPWYPVLPSLITF